MSQVFTKNLPKENASLAKYTAWHVGGKAGYLYKSNDWMDRTGKITSQDKIKRAFQVAYRWGQGREA